jgi:hypothetical protein
MGRECSTNGYRSLVGEPEEKSSLERPRRRRVVNIKIKIRDRMGGVDWIGTSGGRL